MNSNWINSSNSPRHYESSVEHQTIGAALASPERSGSPASWSLEGLSRRSSEASSDSSYSPWGVSADIHSKEFRQLNPKLSHLRRQDSNDTWASAPYLQAQLGHLAAHEREAISTGIQQFVQKYQYLKAPFNRTDKYALQGKEERNYDTVIDMVRNTGLSRPAPFTTDACELSAFVAEEMSGIYNTSRAQPALCGELNSLLQHEFTLVGIPPHCLLTAHTNGTHKSDHAFLLYCTNGFEALKPEAPIPYEAKGACCYTIIDPWANLDQKLVRASHEQDVQAHCQAMLALVVPGSVFREVRVAYP